MNSFGTAIEIVSPSMNCGTVSATKARCCGDILSSSASVLRVSFHNLADVEGVLHSADGLSLLISEGLMPFRPTGSHVC